jgi:histidinol phosphatase-like PHP family hydrolase
MHTFYSDGVLGPSEVAQRARVSVSCRAIAITDHVDLSNVSYVTEAIVRFCEEDHGLRILPGVEVTHVRPLQIEKVIRLAREGGAKVVIVHGETIIEPVEEGTNAAAISAGVDIIAHPGLITAEIAKRAAEAGVALEISGRRGHGSANGHVARMAGEAGATLVFNTDSHAPGDMMDRVMAIRVLIGAGMDEKSAIAVLANSEKIVEEKSGAL